MITEDDIDGLRRHALLHSDFRLAAMCEEASAILRDRARGLTDWPESKPPRAIACCAEALANQRLPALVLVCWHEAGRRFEAMVDRPDVVMMPIGGRCMWCRCAGRTGVVTGYDKTARTVSCSVCGDHPLPAVWGEPQRRGSKPGLLVHRWELDGAGSSWVEGRDVGAAGDRIVRFD